MIKFIVFMCIAHILGDFYFQTENMANSKTKWYKWVLLHSFVYALVVLAAAAVMLDMNPDVLLASLLIAGAHFIIDTIKFLLVRKRKLRNEWTVFYVDQIMHGLSILILAEVFIQWNYMIAYGGAIRVLVPELLSNIELYAKWVLILLVLHKPTNIFVAKFLSQYKPFAESQDVNSIIETKNAGRVIGTIERLIMIILIAINQYSALGLVLTAKSITRYEKISKEKGFAEYYLLGTLMSLLCVLVMSFLLKL
ncbi:MAG: DUF3307 domain-containing protein [Butyrivibrio sp.]|nr:DUF3307 domain-containing protein [Butyrivibrio sp.]